MSPLNAKGRKIMAAMKKSYGSAAKGEAVFYASRNKGIITGVEGAPRPRGRGAPTPKRH